MMTQRTQTTQIIGIQKQGGTISCYLVGHSRVPNAPHEQGHKAQHSPEEIYNILGTGPDPPALKIIIIILITIIIMIITLSSS